MSGRKRPVDHHQMQPCVCDKCATEAHSYPGTTHRWCGGNKAKRRRHAPRGKWVQE